MIDVRQAEAQAALWGIPLVEWMELNTQVFGNVDAFGPTFADDDLDEQWRGMVAQVLVENKLASKANRFLECCRYAHLYECKGPDNHALFAPIYCDLRFCPRCAPRQFTRLVEKYQSVLKAVSGSRLAGFRFREITLTTRNTRELTPDQIKKFNNDAKRTLKNLMKGIKNWGALLCDEVGFNNTNLHAHILFYGPYIAQERLAEVWKEVSGHEVVYIKDANAGGARALKHLLKYVYKPPANDPHLIGLLEVAFHGTRRVHAPGLILQFYWA